MATITCAQAMERFFTYLDETLRGQKLDDLEEHLGICLKCCDRLAFQKHLGEFVTNQMRRSPPPDLDERVRQALAKLK